MDMFLNVLQNHTKTNLWFIHFSSLGEIFRENYFPNSTFLKIQGYLLQFTLSSAITLNTF